MIIIIIIITFRHLFQKGIQLLWSPRDRCKYEWETNFSFASMPRVSCSTRVCYVVPSLIMTSPYFMQSRSVITRSGNRNAGCSSAASLGSKLTNRRRNADPVSSAAVKVEEEEEEARISEQRPSSAPLSTGNVYVRPTWAEHRHLSKYISHNWLT